jgi:hypothetical protein
VLLGLLALGVLAATAQPRLAPMMNGKWPDYVRGSAMDVTVVGQYAYVAIFTGGLAVFDVSNPAKPVRVGGCGTGGAAKGVAVVGNYAYVAASEAGVQVIDVSNPAKPEYVGGCNTSGSAQGVAVAGNRIYVADEDAGLLVFASLPKVQFTFRVGDAVAGTPCVIEATPVLGSAAAWTPLFTNASPSGPFEFVDFNLQGPTQKFYRAHQP